MSLSEINDLVSGDVVRSRSGRFGEDLFHQPAGIFSAMASEGAAVSFLPPLGLGNVRTAFQDAVIELSGTICLMALFAYKNPTTGVFEVCGCLTALR